MSIYLASDREPILIRRITPGFDTVWDIVIGGDQRITASWFTGSSKPVVQRHENVSAIGRIEMQSAVDPDELRESLDREARRAAVEKGAPMPPGIEPTIEYPIGFVVEYRWVWWSVTL